MNGNVLLAPRLMQRLGQILRRLFQVEIYLCDGLEALRYQPETQDQSAPGQVLWVRVDENEDFQSALTQAVNHANKSQEVGSFHPGPEQRGSFYVVPLQPGSGQSGALVIYPIIPDCGAHPEKTLNIAESTPLRPALAPLKTLTREQTEIFRELSAVLGEELLRNQPTFLSLKPAAESLAQTAGSRRSYDDMIGFSAPMQELYCWLDRIRDTQSTILIQGENGTGKELIARSIHAHSQRQKRAFVTVNCSAYNENLLDSELFGHVRGSFTGAVNNKKGLFETANGGTLFLDEVGDMPSSMQVKLLRVLQEGVLTPVGGSTEKKVDVRVLAATHQDLKTQMERGAFREDLYYRLNVINLIVPPLRERREDVSLLVEHFLVQGCQEKQLAAKMLAPKSREILLQHAWPGNVRELKNEIERLIVLSGDQTVILPELLSPRLLESKAKSSHHRTSGRLKDALEALEKQLIGEGLVRTNWNKSRLSKELGISRAGLILKVEKYALDKRHLRRE